MIQSVDSFKLLVAINSEAIKINRVIDCLLQIHIASEETKFGFSMCDLAESLQIGRYIDVQKYQDMWCNGNGYVYIRHCSG